MRYKTTSSTAEIGVYHNSFNSYIYPRNTGEPSSRFPSLNVYQFTGVDALFQGVESSYQVEFLNNWVMTGSLSYTHAKGRVVNEKWQPLSQIPPLQVDLGLKYTVGGLQLGGKTSINARQDRTGEFEKPTDGYTVFNLFSQYRFESGGFLHTFSLNAENIFNRTYRNHLSRIKDLMPEPGRNISFPYRIYF